MQNSYFNFYIDELFLCNAEKLQVNSRKHILVQKVNIGNTRQSVKYVQS